MSKPGGQNLIEQMVMQDLANRGMLLDKKMLIEDAVKQDLKRRGYQVLGELHYPPYTPEEKPEGTFISPATITGVTGEERWKEPSLAETLERHPMPMKTGEELPVLDRLADIGKGLFSGQIDWRELAVDATVKGVTLGNLDAAEAVSKLAGAAGKKVSANEIRQEHAQAWESAIGYYPQKDLEKIKLPVSIAAAMLPYSLVLRGAAPLTGLLKVPALRAAADSLVLGTFSGLARKPAEEDTFKKRLDQIPGDVLFFTLMNGGYLTARQAFRIWKWNKHYKGMAGQKWGRWTDVPDEIVTPGGKVKWGPQDVKNLHQKVNLNDAGTANVKLTEAELAFLEDIKTSPRGWNEARKHGWEMNIPEMRQKIGGPATQAEVFVPPRKPKFGDIFRDPSKIPPMEYEPTETPFPERDASGFAAQPPPPTPGAQPPPPGSQPPPAEPPPPEPPPTTSGARGAPPATTSGVPVSVSGQPRMVNVIPLRGGGWRLQFDIPTVPKEVPAGPQLEEFASPAQPPMEPAPQQPTPEQPPPAEEQIRPAERRAAPREPATYEDVIEGQVSRGGKNIGWDELQKVSFKEKVTVDNLVSRAEKDGFVVVNKPTPPPSIERLRGEKTLEQEMIDRGEGPPQEKLPGKGEGQEVYFKGDKARLTGKRENIHGGDFEEATMLEGPQKGDRVWIKAREKPPAKSEDLFGKPQEKPAAAPPPGPKAEQAGLFQEEELPPAPAREPVSMGRGSFGQIESKIFELEKKGNDAEWGPLSGSEFYWKDLGPRARGKAPRSDYKDLRAAKPDLQFGGGTPTPSQGELRPLPDPDQRPFAEPEPIPEPKAFRPKMPRTVLSKHPLLTWIENKGGLNAGSLEEAGLSLGELANIADDPKLRRKVLRFKGGGANAVRLAGEAKEAGLIGTEDVSELLEAMEEEAAGRRQYYPDEQKDLAEQKAAKDLEKREAAATLDEVDVPDISTRPEDILGSKNIDAAAGKVFSVMAGGDPRKTQMLIWRIQDGWTYAQIGKQAGMSPQAAHKAITKMTMKAGENEKVKAMINAYLDLQAEQLNMGPFPKQAEMIKIRQWINRYFTKEKGASKELDAENERRIREILATTFLGKTEASQLKTWLKEQDNPAVDRWIADVLRGDVSPEALAHVPEDIRKLLTMMRARMDTMSMKILLDGGLPYSINSAIESNLGKYMRRLYRIHQIKGWEPSREARDEFKEVLKAELADFPDVTGWTDADYENFMDNLIAEAKNQKYKPYDNSARQRAKTLFTDPLKKRAKNIDAWRKFAGEIKEDPAWLYMKTLIHQGKIAYQARFLRFVEKEYPQLFADNAREARSRAGTYFQLPATISYGPVRGKWVEENLFEFIRSELEPHVKGAFDWVETLIVWPFKSTKTIFSIPTHARNFLGNILFSLVGRTSIMNPANWSYYRRGLALIKNRKTPAGREAWAELVKLGVIDQQFYGSEIPKLFDKLMKLEPDQWHEALYNATIKKGMNFLGNMYNWEDQIYRIAGFLKMKERLGYSPKQAAAEVDRSYPNYRRLPVAADWLRRWTIFGPFVSFKYNVGKIMWNQASQGIREMRGRTAPPGEPPPPPGGAGGSAGGQEAPQGPGWEEGMPKSFWKGIRRFWRLALFMFAPEIASHVSMLWNDIDKDDIAEIESAMPKWRRGGTFIYLRGKDGKIRAIDLSYIAPIGEFSKVMKNLLRGDYGAAAEAANLLQHPIFDAFQILVKGQDPYWDTRIPGGFEARIMRLARELWVPQSIPIPNLKELIKEGKLEPGNLTTTQIKRIIDAYNQKPGHDRGLAEELVGFFAGIRTYNLDIDKIITDEISNMAYRLREMEREHNAWIRRHPGASEDRLKARLVDFDKKAAEIVKRIKKYDALLKKITAGGI